MSITKIVLGGLKAAQASDWMRHYLTFLCHQRTDFVKILTGSKYSITFTKFVFFWLICQQRWIPWPLNCWDINDFSSATAALNLTKLDRNLSSLFCAFLVDQTAKMAHGSQLHNFRPFGPFVWYFFECYIIWYFTDVVLYACPEYIFPPRPRIIQRVWTRNEECSLTGNSEICKMLSIHYHIFF